MARGHLRVGGPLRASSTDECVRITAARGVPEIGNVDAVPQPLERLGNSAPRRRARYRAVHQHKTHGLECLTHDSPRSGVLRHSDRLALPDYERPIRAALWCPEGVAPVHLA